MLKENILKFLLTEGGNVEVNGHAAEKINISALDDDEYEQYKADLIKMLEEFNAAVEKETGARLYKNDATLKAGKYFSGSSEQFFKYGKEDFVKYKKSLGDIDTQLDKASAGPLKSALKGFEGKKFNGFTYVGTKFGADFNNLFVQPAKYKKVADCIQVDFEFVAMGDDGEVSKFDRFNKNSSYTDLKSGIKGKFKVEFISAMFDAKFKRPGVVFQNKKNELSKAYKKDYVNDWTFGNKGVRQKFSKVLDDEGNQVTHEGIPAFRIKDMVEEDNITDLSKIYEMLFDSKATPKGIEKFDSYLGCLELCNKTWKDKAQRQTLNTTWAQRAAERSLGDKEMYETVMAAFYKVFTDLKPISFEDAGGKVDESTLTFTQFVSMLQE